MEKFLRRRARLHRVDQIEGGITISREGDTTFFDRVITITQRVFRKGAPELAHFDRNDGFVQQG